MNELQKFLTDYYKGEHTTLFSRGSTGLYCLFKSLFDIYGPAEVIIPSICCDTIPASVIYAGLTPVIVDVDQDTLGLSYKSTLEHLTDKTVAIILVYIFGCPFDITEFLELKNQRDIILIEDIAQATGGYFNNNKLGQLGDYTLLSFADTKIIKGKSGALIHRNPDLIEKINKAAVNLPPPPDNFTLQKKELSWRNLTHAFFDLAKANPSTNITKPFLELLPHYSDIFLYHYQRNDEDKIIVQFNSIEADSKQRYDKYFEYKENINSEYISIIDFPQGSTCWRLPILAQDSSCAFAITNQLWENGILVSNHYFPQEKLYNHIFHQNSKSISARIINLWVDHLATQENIDRTIKIINLFHPE